MSALVRGNGNSVKIMEIMPPKHNTIPSSILRRTYVSDPERLAQFTIEQCPARCPNAAGRDRGGGRRCCGLFCSASALSTVLVYIWCTSGACVGGWLLSARQLIE